MDGAGFVGRISSNPNYPGILSNTIYVYKCCGTIVCGLLAIVITTKQKPPDKVASFLRLLGYFLG